MPATIKHGGPVVPREVNQLPQWRDLDTPSGVSFTIVADSWYQRTTPGGHVESGFYAMATEVTGAAFGLPYGPNPRKPIKCTPGTNIENSAVNSGDALIPSNQFVLANNGIDIVATATENGGVVTLEFEDGQGIINGGLTYYTISRLAGLGLHADTMLSFRIWTYDAVITPPMKTNIAEARNSHRPVSSADLANQNGLLVSLQEGLGDLSQKINWSTGDVDYHEWLAAQQGGASLGSQDYVKILKAMVCEEGQYHPTVRPIVPDLYSSHQAGKILTGGKACLEEYVNGFGD
jgi:hypothetical protein